MVIKTILLDHEIIGLGHRRNIDDTEKPRSILILSQISNQYEDIRFSNERCLKIP